MLTCLQSEQTQQEVLVENKKGRKDGVGGIGLFRAMAASGKTNCEIWGSRREDGVGQKCKKLEVLIWSQDLAFSKGGTCREIEAGELQ